MFGMLDDMLAMSMAVRARRNRQVQTPAATPATPPVTPPVAAPAPQKPAESTTDKVAATMPRECPALVHLSLRGGDVKVCPRCGKEIKHPLYKDKKGWLFARCCFGKGSGPVKEATDNRVDNAQLAALLASRGALAGTGHHRMAISKKLVSLQDFLREGFEPVIAAIPEHGQDQWTSYRHPDSTLHIHSHPEYWTAHVDRHPSATMAVRKASTLGGKLMAAVSGAKHVATEGIPGAYYYLRNKLPSTTPRKTMVDAIRAENPRAVIEPTWSNRIVYGIARSMKPAANSKDPAK